MQHSAVASVNGLNSSANLNSNVVNFNRVNVSSLRRSQIIVITYHKIHLSLSTTRTYIQKSTHEEYNFVGAVIKHLTNLEGFILLTTYLSLYWISGCMPSSYYAYQPDIPWFRVFASLLITDLIQYIMHRIEHVIPSIYKVSFAVSSALKSPRYQHLHY